MIIEFVLYTLGVTSGILISKKLNKKPKKNKLGISENLKFSDIPNYWQYKIGDKLLIARSANAAYKFSHEMIEHLNTILAIKNNDFTILSKELKKSLMYENPYNDIETNLKYLTYEAEISKMSIDLIEVNVTIMCRVPYDLKNNLNRKFFIKPISIIKNISLEKRIEKETFNRQEQELTELITLNKEIYE